MGCVQHKRFEVEKVRGARRGRDWVQGNVERKSDHGQINASSGLGKRETVEIGIKSGWSG